MYLECQTDSNRGGATGKFGTDSSDDEEGQLAAADTPPPPGYNLKSGINSQGYPPPYRNSSSSSSSSSSSTSEDDEAMSSISSASGDDDLVGLQQQPSQVVNNGRNNNSQVGNHKRQQQLQQNQMRQPNNNRNLVNNKQQHHHNNSVIHHHGDSNGSSNNISPANNISLGLSYNNNNNQLSSSQQNLNSTSSSPITVDNRPHILATSATSTPPPPTTVIGHDVDLHNNQQLRRQQHHHVQYQQQRQEAATTSEVERRSYNQIQSEQQQQAPPAKSTPEIREVWHHNLYDEFLEICTMAQEYPFVAMDTEFPGVVITPHGGSFASSDEYRYQLVKVNVDSLKMIQLGITLFDREGNRPTGVCTWQFNFRFSLNDDMYATDSIDLLMNSGIQFDAHRTSGIDPDEFAEMLIGSGLVLMDNITWLTFHSAYDFGYLMKLLTSAKLPDAENDFFELLRTYFPNMYDIKYLMSTTEGIPINGGLQRIADELQVDRIGTQHQAGSDSLLTGQVFFKMYEQYFKDIGLDDVKYNGQICGMGNSSHLGLLANTPGRKRREYGASESSPARGATGGARRGNLLNTNSTKSGTQSPAELSSEEGK